MLGISLAGLKLRVPLILPSGILGLSPAFFQGIQSDLGAITTKSIGVKPRKGNPTPTVIPLPYGLLNAMGLPNPGIDRYIEVIEEAKRRLEIPLIVSVFGGDEDEYLEVASKAEEAGADAVEANLSCPHERLVSIFSEDPLLARKVVSTLSGSLKIPLFVKLSPNIGDIGRIASVCEDAGADGITAINTLRAMKIDLELKRPILSARYGGLSGPAIHPLAVRCIYEIYEAVSIPIIGMGGVTGWEDAVELILAGASAVGIGTAISTQGLEIFRLVAEGIKGYMESHGFKGVEEMVGVAHEG